MLASLEVLEASLDYNFHHVEVIKDLCSCGVAVYFTKLVPRIDVSGSIDQAYHQSNWGGGGSQEPDESKYEASLGSWDCLGDTAPDYLFPRMPRRRIYSMWPYRGALLHVCAMYSVSQVTLRLFLEICPLDQKVSRQWFQVILPLFCFGQAKPRGFEFIVMDYLRDVFRTSQGVPVPLIVALVVSTVVGIAVLFYLALFIVAPIPRPPLRSEKTYRTIEPGEYSGDARPLPCWQDKYNAQKDAARRRGDSTETDLQIEEPEVFMSLVVPAFNEEERLGIMLTEAVEYLQHAYGNEVPKTQANGNRAKRKDATREISNGYTEPNSGRLPGWEILVVSDGSTDKTIDTALQFARDLGGKSASCIRVISLHQNRGKGGAVTHGMRHVRGQYAIFADADGASKFEDLGKLVRASKKIEDAGGRGVAVGSRAHLVGSEAVVKRSFLRNLLMHSFHLLLRLLTPPATAAIRDTQCGFKLFSRPSLPYIIPYMHSEGWIFDVEMLMLAESAGIPVAEVPIGWQEVKGSKLNVLWDSLGMAWGLAVLRAAWGLGVYRRS